MGFLQHLGLDNMEEGKTLPPVNRQQDIPPATIHHLKKFEDIASALVKTRDAMNRNIRDMAELERATIEARDEINQERQDLEFKLNTLKDQLKQHVESLPVDAQLTFVTPPPPPPDALDVTIRTAQEREEQ